VDGLLDLDRRDVLAAGRDDVLATVAEPQDPIGVEPADGSPMPPSSRRWPCSSPATTSFVTGEDIVILGGYTLV
jgi:hypothetical protein